MAKFKIITMQEFMEATRTPADCWIFKDNGPERNFHVRTPDPEDKSQDVIYYFDDGKDMLHSFKEREDGEIWHSMRLWSRKNILEHCSCWNMWQPWTGHEW